MSEPVDPPLADQEPIPIEIEMGDVTLRPGDLVDMYRYERPIGKGGMAYVLLATDPGGQQVALKVLKSNRMRTGLTRFRREFRALSKLDHPNIIRVESWGDVYGHPYLAMEYVDGIDLHLAMRRMFRRPPEVRWPWVEDVLIQLARALGHLARRGLVHRDLKPSNVLIDREGTCKLTDFGIVKDLDPSQDPVVSSTLVGTWAYASPEQIAGEQIDHRSDLYSLGIILYAMITGRRPFAADTMKGYLDLHQSSAPTPPSRLVPGVPAILESVCLRLLAKSPRDRFQSASEILDVLLEDEPETDPEAVLPLPSWQPPLVGREAPLQAVSEALAALTRGEGQVLLFEGPEGVGRSRLLQAAVDEVHRRGLPVYQARLSQGEGAFEALLRLARDIGGELGGNAPPELGRAIARFAQGRGRLPGDARYQLFDGVRTALVHLLEQGPQVLALDDLHDAPGPTIDLLGYLVRSLVARDGRPLLVLATARQEARRDEEPPEASTYAAFRLGRDLGLTPRIEALGALSAAQIQVLAEALLGPGGDGKALALRLWEATEGDPLFVVEFVRGLLHRGLIQARPAGGGWHLAVAPEELTGDRLALPPGLRQVIRERIAPLDDAARALLEVVAVAEREIDVDVIIDVAELEPEDQSTEVTGDVDLPRPAEPEADRWLDALDRLVESGLLLEQRLGIASTVRLAQRQVGEVVRGDLPDSTRARLHRRLAAALELRFSDSPVAAEAIGEHYRRAGEVGRAWGYLVQAATGLLERSLLAEAGALVARARALQEEAARDARSVPEQAAEHQQRGLDLDQVEAELLFNRGDWEAAERALRTLRVKFAALGHPVPAAEAGIKLGTTLRRLGRADEGEAVVRRVLVEARTRHNRRLELMALQGLAGAAWGRGDLDACERLATQGLVGSTDPELAEGRAGVLLALTAVQASRGQLAAAIAGLAEAEELLRGLREKRTRANVLVNLAELLSWRGDLPAALTRADEALALARDVVYRVVEASALRARGLALMAMGDGGRARLDLEHGLALARELGITEEEVPIRFHLARLALQEGDAETAEDQLLAARAAAVRADPEQYGPAIEALLAWSLAMQGAPAEARRAVTLAQEAMGRLQAPRRTELQVQLARALTALGEDEQACAMAQLAAQTAEAMQFRTWALEAWACLSRLEADPDQAARARAAGAALAREMLAALPPERAVGFRRDRSVVTLLGVPLL